MPPRWPSSERRSFILKEAGDGTENAADISSGSVPLALQAKSEPFDTRPFAKMMINLSMASSTRLKPLEDGEVPPPEPEREDETGPDAAKLHVSIEHSDSNAGPWSLLQSFEPTSSPSEPRLLARLARLVVFKRFVRLSWYFARTADPLSTITDDVRVVWAVLVHASPHGEEPLTMFELEGGTWEELVAKISESEAA